MNALDMDCKKIGEGGGGIRCDSSIRKFFLYWKRYQTLHHKVMVTQCDCLSSRWNI